MGLLVHDELIGLHAAVVSARLAGSRSALLTGIDRAFVAGLDLANDPSDQVLQDLDALNAVDRLGDGSIPLMLWLKNAIARSRPMAEAGIFEAALDRVRHRCGEAGPVACNPSIGSLDESPPAPEVIEVTVYNDDLVLSWTGTFPGKAQIADVIRRVLVEGTIGRPNATFPSTQHEIWLACRTDEGELKLPNFRKLRDIAAPPRRSLTFNLQWSTRVSRGGQES